MIRLAEGRGPLVFDQEGRAYVDWVMGHGALLLGHGRREIREAVREQALRGILLPGPTSLEEEVEEKVLAFFPHHRATAFGKNGSDVCTASVRLARAITGREGVLHYGYHGFHDGFVASDRSVRGVPASLQDLVHHIPYGDLDALEGILRAHGERVAALIVEPFREVLPWEGYLQGIRRLCDRFGVVLVFDEIVTGFRVSPGGAQEAFGVRADLTCLGKALSAGMPLSALLGPAEWIGKLEELRFGMTTRAEQLSLAAAAASLPLLEDPGVSERAAGAGRRLREGFREVCRRGGIGARMEGHPAMMRVTFEEQEGRSPEELLESFVTACRREGLWTNGTFLASALHGGEALDHSLGALARALESFPWRGEEFREEGNRSWST